MFDRLRVVVSSRRFRLLTLSLLLILAASLHPQAASAINCTFQFCPVANPCPGSILLNAFCCRPGQQLACFYAFDGARGCVSGVSGFCY